VFTRSFQYVDLQGSTVPSPTSNEGRVTSSISSNGESTVRIDDISPSNSDSVDKLLRQQRRKRSFMILAGVCGVAVITIIALTYHDSATKIITAIPSAFSSASQGRTGQPFTHHGLISPTFYKQLLCSQNPKVQKTLFTLLSFCTFGISLHKSCH